jgi:hypothetical protein
MDASKKIRLLALRLAWALVRIFALVTKGDRIGLTNITTDAGIYAKIDTAKFGARIVPYTQDTLTGDGDSATNLATACHVFDNGNVPPK